MSRLTSLTLRVNNGTTKREQVDTGNISKQNKTQGTKIIKANSIGNKTVQQKDIS